MLVFSIVLFFSGAPLLRSTHKMNKVTDLVAQLILMDLQRMGHQRMWTKFICMYCLILELISHLSVVESYLFTHIKRARIALCHGSLWCYLCSAINRFSAAAWACTSGLQYIMEPH